MGLLILVLAILIVVGLAVALVVVHNRLTKARNGLDEAWAQIDVQLTRRHRTIGDLVEIVKAAAAHEAATITRVVDARRVAEPLDDPARRGSAEVDVEGSVKELLARSEAYPDLTSNQNFAQLSGQLVELEDDISAARRYFNGRVRIFNTMIASVPYNLLAGPLGMASVGYFQAERDERSAPRAS